MFWPFLYSRMPEQGRWAKGSSNVRCGAMTRAVLAIIRILQRRFEFGSWTWALRGRGASIRNSFEAFDGHKRQGSLLRQPSLYLYFVPHIPGKIILRRASRRLEAGGGLEVGIVGQDVLTIALIHAAC